MSEEKLSFKWQFRVWHIPQVPGKPFTAEVPTFAEAVRLRNTLAGYDEFQLENNIKPNYCNASGIQFFDHTLTDEDLEEMQLGDRWVDINTADDLQNWIDEFAQNGTFGYHPIPPMVKENAAAIILELSGSVLETKGDLDLGDTRVAERLVQRIYDDVVNGLNAEL